MFGKVLDCPRCRKRFHYECDGPIPPRIVCPECHVESPMEEFSAVIICSECRSKLKLPLDMLDTPGVVCPKCGMTLVGETLNCYDEEEVTSNLEETLISKAVRRLLADGELFDKYRVVRLLGRGGMAEVYLAEHLLLQRPCALKLMRRELADDAVFIKRFIREAKLANRIDHPNIVRVYDAGSDFKTGLLFLAMEYVEGKTLHEMMREKLPTEAELREILVAMAGALKALAELHVIHRDIKPSNIMRTTDGVYKLMDLGIAKSEDDRSSGEMTLTVGQTAIGTPAYASPEQCRSAHNVDIRSDIYCLGATLYHLASGRVPFDGETPVAVILKVMQSQPEPLARLRPDLSRGFIDLIERMMEKNPDDRPASPDELLSLVSSPDRAGLGGRALGFRRLAAGIRRRPWTRPQKIAAVAVLAVAALAVLAVAAGRNGPAAAPSPGIEEIVPVVPPAPAEEIPAAPASPPAPVPPAQPDAPAAPPAPVVSPAQPDAPAAPPAAAPSAPPPPAVREFSALPTIGPLPVTLEERLRHVMERLRILRAIGNLRSESAAQREFRNYQIKVREEQLEQLNRQQEIRAKALELKAKPRHYSGTQEFQKKFARFSAERRGGAFDSRSDESADEMLAMLKSGKVDPNVTVTDSNFPRASGPLIRWLMYGAIRRQREMVETLLKLGADVTPVAEDPECRKAGFRWGVLFPVCLDGGFDAMRGLLLPCCRMRPFDENLVSGLLQLDHNVEERDEEGNTALHHAAAAGAERIVMLIVVLDGDVNARNKAGETPLFAATRNNRDAVIRRLIALGADPSIRSNSGQVAADTAVQGQFWNEVKRGNVAEAREHLKNGAAVNAFSDGGSAALHIACRERDSAMVAMLLAAGADPNLKQQNPRQFTPLQIVARRENFDAGIAAALLAAGADPNVPPARHRGVTLLHALCSFWNELDENQQLDLLKVLLDSPRTSLVDNYRKTHSLFTVAIERQRPRRFTMEFLKYIKEFQPDDPVLIPAVEHDFPESFIRVLLAKKANPNAVDGNRTALKAAVTGNQQRSLVKLLLDHGADPDWKDADGKRIRELPTTSEIREILQSARPLPTRQ